MDNKLISDIAARAKDIEERIKEETSDLEEFRIRGARGGSPIKRGELDEEKEMEAKREWQKPAMKRLGEKKEVDDDRTVERRRKRQKRGGKLKR